MFSNISPYVCCNMYEFKDEIDILNEITFPKLKSEFKKININFDPIQIKWDEQNDFAKSGHLLRLLLHNIQKSSPFFICLLGQQYGPYLEKKDSKFISKDNKQFNWIEKNLSVASKTGFSNIVNSMTYYNSILEFQINTALSFDENYPYYRFYYRQLEFIEDKYNDLPAEESRKMIANFETENSYCATKIKDLKIKIAKKGLNVKYYRTLEQLVEFINQDFFEIIQSYLYQVPSINKSRSIWHIENLVFRKLNKYIITKTIRNLIVNLKNFCEKKFDLIEDKKEKKNTVETLSDNSENEIENYDTTEFSEILKLRHLNLANTSTNGLKKPNSINVFLVHGQRGSGKTSFMLKVYQSLSISSFGSFGLEDEINSNLYSNSDSTDKISDSPFYLFYFLESHNSMLPVLIDIIQKMRERYAKTDSKSSLNYELHDLKSILEQYRGSLCLGPVTIFIDGLSEIDSKNTVKLNSWLPNEILTETKFVITLRKSSEYYSELITRQACLSHEIQLFENDIDYRNFYAKQLLIENFGKFNQFSYEKNVLYEKFLSILPELKMSNHYENPLFNQIIAQEIFSFDEEIFQTYSIHNSDQQYNDKEMSESYDYPKSMSSFNVSSNKSQAEANVIISYIEEVITLREIIQKVIKRCLKKNNWSTDTSQQISIENSGWVGYTLCLIAISRHGITKESILNILSLLGYREELEIDELSWQIFRMVFEIFIVDGVNGTLLYSHDYYKEAVQSLLLEGFSVSLDSAAKNNISEKEKEIHSLIVIDILKFRIEKSQLDNCAQIEDKNLQVSSCTEYYFQTIHELMYHLYMTNDLINLSKFLTNYKILQIFNECRMIYLNEWYEFLSYLKQTFNSQVLRSILVSNFTAGLPQFALEIKQGNLNLRMLSDYEIKPYLNEVNSNIKEHQSKFANTIVLQNDLDERNKKSPRKQETAKSRSQNSYAISIMSIKSEIEISEIYVDFVDKLLDLSEVFDLSNSENGDSKNLLFASRAIILIDLMKNLDDKYFLENFSYSLCRIVDSTISQNYPLNDLEKLYYGYLLHELVKMTIQMNNIELGLKFSIKCIEIFDDLSSTFHISELSKKFKTKQTLFQIRNKLSILHSNMAFLLLKFDNLNGASMLLHKAKSYNEKKMNKTTALLELDLKIEQTIKNNFKENAEKRDSENLLHEQSLASMFDCQEIDINLDDASSYDGKYYYLFISSLLEVQQMNFHKAKKNFQAALKLCTNWYGDHHFNTSKVYHYYGCFYSLLNSEYYNPRRAELYLRKALFIQQKEAELSVHSMKINKSAFTQASLLRAVESSTETYLSQINFAEKMMSNENQNYISEILFDLGSLLSTFESTISKREAIESIQRSLDIKALIFGVEHPDCKVIKEKLNEIIFENTQLNEIQSEKHISNLSMRNDLTTNTRQNVFTRPSTAIKSFPETTSRIKLINCIHELKDQMGINKISKYNAFDNWIKKNSIIEKIPSRLNRIKLENNSKSWETNSTYASKLDRESYGTNTQTANESISQTPEDIVEIQQEHSESMITRQNALKSKMMTRKMEKINSAKSSRNPILAKLVFPWSSSASNLRLKLSTRNETSLHFRNCKCPTALSIDVHNTISVNGPNSSLKNILNSGAPNKNLREKSTKNIYYKSAWYDLPVGCCNRRYRNFIKKTSTA